MIPSPFNFYYCYPDAFAEQGSKFFAAYQLEREVVCPDEKIKGLKDKRTRVCRFCGKQAPDVT